MERPRKHYGQHEDCFGCKLHSIQWDPRAMPSRKSSAPPRTPNPAWERGVPTDNRGMPFLNAEGKEMGQKEFSQKRSQIEANRRRLRQAPAETLQEHKL